MLPIAAFFSLVFLCSPLSRRLERTVLMASILFTAAGALAAASPGALAEPELDRHGVPLAAKLRLVMLVFTDASRVAARLLRRRPSLSGEPTARLAVVATGLLNTFAHGPSALPGIRRYAAAVSALKSDAPERQAPDRSASTGDG